MLILEEKINLHLQDVNVRGDTLGTVLLSSKGQKTLYLIEYLNMLEGEE